MGRGRGRTASILSQMQVPNPCGAMASKSLGEQHRVQVVKPFSLNQEIVTTA